MAGYFDANEAAVLGWDTLHQNDFVVYSPNSSQCSVDPEFYGCSSLSWNIDPGAIVHISPILVEPSDNSTASGSWDNQLHKVEEVKLDSRHERRRSQNRASQRAFRQRKQAFVSELERRLLQMQCENDRLREANKCLFRQLTLRHQNDLAASTSSELTSTDLSWTGFAEHVTSKRHAERRDQPRQVNQDAMSYPINHHYAVVSGE